MTPLRVLILAIALPVAASCQAVLGFEDFEAQSAGGSSANAGAGAASGGASATGGSVGGGAGGTGGPCEHQDAPVTMVGVRLTTGDCVWIDATEVTRGSYQAFVQALVDPAPYIHQTACSWKGGAASFTPSCDTDAAAPAGDALLPVTCVDWCDAWAYCTYQGGQLCDEQSWQQACGSGGPQHEYPYGSLYDAEACNGSDNSALGCGSGCQLAPAGDLSYCSTPNGIRDLSGNASEWVDDCNGYSAETQECRVRGGSVAQKEGALQCDSSLSTARRSRGPYMGFRCCWQPPP
jgi:formylglycine-generating enzyme